MRVCDDDDDDVMMMMMVCVCVIYKCHVAYIYIGEVDEVGRSVVPLSSRACVSVRGPQSWSTGGASSTTQSVRRCVGGGVDFRVVSCRVVSCRRTCGSQRNELANDDDDDDDDDDGVVVVVVDGFFGFDEEEEDDDEADDDDDDASWTTRRRMRAPMR